MPRHVYPIPFVIHPPDDLARQQPELRRLSHKLADKYADRQVVTDADLRTMGGALWSALTPDVHSAFDTAHQTAGATILPVIIESGVADVQAWPWETLYHPEQGFLGKHVGLTLTRRIKAPPTGAPPLDKGPLRVLLFTSLPNDVDPEKARLNVEEEQVQVQEALMPWISNGRVKLEMPDDGRLATLKAWLKSFQPHLLFLSGHGRFHHEPHTGEAPYGEFLFESEAGDGEPIRDDQMARALIGMGVQVVVVSACESSKTSPASEALNTGLAQRLSAQGIPHVIGMRESILDQAGIQFARALCDEVAQQERIDTALQTARIAIQTPLKGPARREAGLGAAEELSLGQWCLPMLLSANPQNPLIDWDFTPQAVEARVFNRRLNTVSLPARFVGRRAELRRYKSDLLKGSLQKLLITGPGGQGKTSLAGKLALDLLANGYHVFAWSARPENPWREFELELEMALDETRGKNYDRLRAKVENDAKRAQGLIDLVLEQFNGQVVLFFDNLESVQDPRTLGWTDPLIRAWMEAAQTTAGLILLVTSRWKPPGWRHEQLLLERANYGDFLRLAQELAGRGHLAKTILHGREWLRQVYTTLGGNCRGLEFFAAATLALTNADEEQALLEALAQTKEDLQANMAIEAIYQRLPEDAQRLLRRLPAYYEPVPLEGFIKLGLDLLEPETLVERLLAVSLLEAQVEPCWEAVQYQCAPMVQDWLETKGLRDEDPAWPNAAADYHVYLRRYERRTLTQAMAAHHALRRAGRHTEADRLTLDAVVGPLTRRGFYATLLTEWLPRICDSQDPSTRGEALGQTGKLLHHLGDFKNALPYMKQSLAICQQIGDKAGEGTTLNNISQIFKAQGDYETALTYLKQSLAIRQQIGDKAGEGTTLNNISQIYDAQGDYETALTYLKQSLAICQQIGDRAGLCATLFNMGHIHLQNKQVQEAVSAWVTVYVIAKPMNLAQVLQALANLAPQLGLPEGLEGWERLAQQFQSGAGEGGSESGSQSAAT